MSNYLIDTDIFIDYFKGIEKAQSLIEILRGSGDRIFFSAVTEIELLSGRENEVDDTKISTLNFLSPFSKIGVDNHIAVIAGDFRRRHLLGLGDSIIAATAYALKIPLITRNIKDFSKINRISLKKPY